MPEQCSLCFEQFWCLRYPNYGCGNYEAMAAYKASLESSEEFSDKGGVENV